ncbi:MAG TPA: RING finger family 4 domain-containing protein [Kofleriaceae bacterium]|nr:RING finger family 4 domain-containing protein [Kofleriaceae bacterium]
MDPIRTLLLARTHTVVLDPDRVAAAATRPSRDVDVDRFEDELVQLGYVMSLDLAMTIRRFPHQAIQELRSWMIETLGKPLGAQRPQVPLVRNRPTSPPRDAPSVYLQRVMTWLHARPDQPCPWCGEIKRVGALDPCGHLVCRTCWDGGNFAGCPICHRRVAPGDPFVRAASPEPIESIEPIGPIEPVAHHAGDLRLVHLAFDVVGVARSRFERLISAATPLAPADRQEVETVIDAMGPKAAIWLPAKIPVRETMAIAVARLWIVAPDRTAMVRATQGHLRSATDVLRVAAVLMGADPALREPLRLRSIGRGLRRAILEALDRLVPEQLLEDVMHHRALWRRVGERLHPYELAERLPTAALAFAAVRGTDLARATFGRAIRAQAQVMTSVRIADDRIAVARWAAPIERALHDRDPRAAAARLVERPGALLARVDHLVREIAARDPERMPELLAFVSQAISRGAPATLLVLASHLARRSAPAERRVFVPRGDVRRAWAMPDARRPLPAEAIASITATVRGELVARAETRRHFARAVIDRGLVDLPVALGDRVVGSSRLAWPRGSELAIPEGARVALHGDPALALAIACFDDAWRHVATMRGDAVELDATAGRHAVLVVSSDTAIEFDRVRAAIAIGDALRFELHGTGAVAVPATIDLATRRLRWIDVRSSRRGSLDRPGALARIARDLGDLAGSGARPSLWELACIHAAARANSIYIRERDGRITACKRRDGEPTVARLARLASGELDGTVASIPPANAPTWLAVLRDDLAIPPGSAGYVLDARGPGTELLRRSAADLVGELAAR